MLKQGPNSLIQLSSNNNLHQSISFLTTQIKQLEQKYLNLADFYKNQRLSTPSKKQNSANKTPRSELRDQIKKDLNPLMNNFTGEEIEKKMIGEAMS